MAIIERPSDETLIALGYRTLIGRSEGCALRLDNRRISLEHASIRWRDAQWLIRDLGSRNGTRLNGAHLAPGTAHPLSEGDQLNLGGEECWQVRDVSPPGAAAVRLSDKRLHRALNEILVLPGSENPVVMVYANDNGTWEIESPSPAINSVVQVLDEQWLLLLPATPLADPIATTWDATSQPLVFEEMTLNLLVSRDEEHIEARLVVGDNTIQLAARAYHQLTLLLARTRLTDMQSGLEYAEQGWLYTDDICKMLRIKLSLLNLYMYRARQQIAAQGVVGAARLFERRRMSGQLRLGTALIEVHAL